MRDEFHEAEVSVGEIVRPHISRREFGNPKVEVEESGEYRSMRVIYKRIGNRIGWIDLSYHTLTGKWGSFPAGRGKFHKNFQDLTEALAYVEEQTGLFSEKRREAIRQNKWVLDKACLKSGIGIKDAYDKAEIKYWQGLLKQKPEQKQR